MYSSNDVWLYNKFVTMATMRVHRKIKRKVKQYELIYFEKSLISKRYINQLHCVFLLGGKQSDPSKGSDLNKSKTSDKKQKVNITDDTKQPGK